jgi:hypothetical protein
MSTVDATPVVAKSVATANAVAASAAAPLPSSDESSPHAAAAQASMVSAAGRIRELIQGSHCKVK